MQVGASQVGALQVGALQEGASQVGALQVDVEQDGALQVGAIQVGVDQHGVDQVGAIQVGATQVASGPVDARRRGRVSIRVRRHMLDIFASGSRLWCCRRARRNHKSDSDESRQPATNVQSPFRVHQTPPRYLARSSPRTCRLTARHIRRTISPTRYARSTPPRQYLSTKGRPPRGQSHAENSSKVGDCRIAPPYQENDPITWSPVRSSTPS